MAKYLNEDGVGLMLQNINDHINTKLSNYLPKTTPIPTNTSDLTNDSGFVTSADTIAAANTVKTMKFGTCSTAASTQVKGVTISGFNVEVGAQIRIKFSNVNTNANPKLSVNGGTAYPIYYNGSAITSSNFTFDVDKIYVFTFTSINSTNCWVLEGDWDSITSATVSGWGFTKNAGTITGITMNGASKGTSGVVNLGTVVTDVSNKQDKLVSGTNIKTINGTSVLGSGNIEVSAPKHIFSLQGIHESGYLVGRIEGSTTIPTAVGSIICILNAMNGDVEITSSTPLLFEVGDEYKEFTVTDNTESFTVKLSDSISFMLIDETTLSPIVPRTSSSGSGGPSMYAYGTCNTATGTGIKVVTLADSNFTVSKGSIVAVKFAYTNSIASSSLQLSVAGVTAQIKYLNNTFPSNQHWTAGSIVEFIYDGSAWQVLGNIKDNVGTDTKVTQTITTTNSTYPLLFSATANKSATSADAARFSSNLKYNPSTQSLLFPAATSGKSVNIGLGAKPSGIYNGLVIYNAGGSQSDADFINICASDVIFRKADGSMGGTINAELTGASSWSRDAGSNWYGTCSSLASASTKVVDLCNIILGEGSRVWINFTNGNTYTGEQVTMSITTANGSVSAVLDFYNFIGGESGGTSLSGYTAGISILPGAYEFIYLDSKLKYTGNYVADRAPEILVKSAITGTGAAITFELVKNMHTVFNIGTKPRALVLTIPSASETYSCEFTTGAASMTFRYPSTLKWVNGILPTLEMSTTYHLSIVNNCAAIVAFKAVEPS